MTPHQTPTDGELYRQFIIDTVFAVVVMFTTISVCLWLISPKAFHLLFRC